MHVLALLGTHERAGHQHDALAGGRIMLVGGDDLAHQLGPVAAAAGGGQQGAGCQARRAAGIGMRHGAAQEPGVNQPLRQGG